MEVVGLCWFGVFISVFYGVCACVCECVCVLGMWNMVGYRGELELEV